MRFLDTLDLYLTESKDPFNLYPMDYDSEDSNASFGIDIDDTDDNVAKVIIRTLDGAAIDALGGSYNYDDVYADITIKGDTDDPKNLDLISWVINKLIKLGYSENTIMVDGKKYYENDANNADDSEEEVSDGNEDDSGNTEEFDIDKILADMGEVDDTEDLDNENDGETKDMQ